MSKLDNTALTELHFAATYAQQAGCKTTEIDTSNLLELVDVYQLLKGQSAFEAFKEQVARARRAEAQLADLRMRACSACLLRAVELGAQPVAP